MTPASAAVAASAPASNSSRPLAVRLLPPELSGTTGFFPFDDLEMLGDRGADAASFRNFLVLPSAGDDAHVDLFPTGCRLRQSGNGDDGAADCPRACRRAATLFGSLETFYNCVALSSVAYWTRAPPPPPPSSRPSPPPPPSRRYHVPDEAARNASLVMAGTLLAAFDERPVLASFVACAQAVCADGDGIRKPCSDAVKALTPRSSPPDVFDAMASFCPSIPVEVNPDIFGPGVRTAQPRGASRSRGREC